MVSYFYRKIYQLFYRNIESKSKIQGYIRRAAFAFLNLKCRDIKLHINNVCNLRCKNCYCNFDDNFALDTDKIISLLDQLTINKNLNLHILGGEPLLRSDIFEIIAYAKKKIKKIVLFTNATLISNELAYKIKQSGIKAVIVPLHSCFEEIHDNITQTPGSWKKTISGMKSLIRAKVSTHSFTILMSCNAGQLSDIEHFVKNLGAKTIYFPYIRQEENDSLSIGSNDKFQESINWAFNKSAKYKNKLLKRLSRRPKACSAFVSIINIKSDGTITPCPFVNLELGNIRKEGFYSILNKCWSNKELLDFLSIPSECKTCYLVNVCGGGCKAFKYNVYRDAKNKDYNCAGPYKNTIPLQEMGCYVPYIF